MPQSVLLGVSYLESRWDTNAGTPSTSGGYGPMHLTDAAHVAALPGRGTTTTATEDPRGDDSRPRPATRATGRRGTRAVRRRRLQTRRRRRRADRPRPGGAAHRRRPPTSAAAPRCSAAYQTGAGRAGRRRQRPGGLVRRGGPLLRRGQRRRRGGLRRRGLRPPSARAPARTTDDGQRVTLPRPRGDSPSGPGWTGWACAGWPARTGRVPAPTSPASGSRRPTRTFGDGDYGNHDLADRPARQKIEYIVIHDTEASSATTLNLVQDPTYVSWHYTLRSVDGHIAQHVKTKDVAWHAGNWYVNAKSIGLEHEGFAGAGHLVHRGDVPDLGEAGAVPGAAATASRWTGSTSSATTTCPAPSPRHVPGMHWDPGPYWDWTHYFDLLHAPFDWTPARPATGLVTIDPDYATNQPAFTGCISTPGVPCAPRGSSAVVLRTAPPPDAPLVNDIGAAPGRHPEHDGSVRPRRPGVRRADVRGRRAAGRLDGDLVPRPEGLVPQPGVRADRQWTDRLSWSRPKPGRATIPVYGRAYPEQAAYPAGVPVPGDLAAAVHLRRRASGTPSAACCPASTTGPARSTAPRPVTGRSIRGKNRYAQIQFGHRIMYVNLADVQLILPSPVGAPSLRTTKAPGRLTGGRRVARGGSAGSTEAGDRHGVDAGHLHRFAGTGRVHHPPLPR